jgi:hypothetical protein
MPSALERRDGTQMADHILVEIRQAMANIGGSYRRDEPPQAYKLGIYPHKNIKLRRACIWTQRSKWNSTYLHDGASRLLSTRQMCRR